MCYLAAAVLRERERERKREREKERERERKGRPKSFSPGVLLSFL
jgi:threonine/homoserine/homoserine lactone efflux protein